MTPMLRNCITCITIGVLAICVSGCSDVADENLYMIERLHFKAEKLKQQKLGIKPELLTDADYDEIINAFMSVINTFELNYGRLSEKDSLTDNERKASYLAGQCLIELAFLHDTRGDEESSIKTLEGFSSRFPHNRDQKALALLQLGRKQVRVGNAERAETAWMELIEDFYPPADRQLHPNTDVLSLPIDLATLFASLEDSAKAEKYLDFAEEYYRKIIDEYRQSPLGLTTTRFLADTYMLRRRPEEAISLLETVSDTSGAPLGAAKLLIADIYLNGLYDTLEARKQYEAVIASERDTMSHPKAHMQLARIEFMQENFNECRVQAGVLKSRFDNYQSLQPEVQQIVARSFDREGDFGRAFSEYEWLIRNYPESIEAVDTYVYLPQFLRRNEQPELAAEWQEKAVRFLQDAKESEKGTFFGMTTHSGLIHLLVEMERWEQAASELEKLQVDYPRSAIGSSALLKAGNIYLDKLNNKERARQCYERQVNSYLDLPISEEAGVKLKELQKSG